MEGAALSEPSLEKLLAEKLAHEGMQGKAQSAGLEAPSESRVGTQMAMEAYGIGACLLTVDENGDWTEESLARCQEAAWQEFQAFGTLEYE
jgi:hypothetical protein